MSKKIALYVDPNFLENFGVQDIKPEVSPATAHNNCLHSTHLGVIDVHHALTVESKSFTRMESFLFHQELSYTKGKATSADVKDEHFHKKD